MGNPGAQEVQGEEEVTNSNAWAKERRKALIEKFGGKCQICGCVPSKFEFAHKEPTSLFGRSRGRKERLVDVAKFPTKYLLLCHSCHEWYDMTKAGATVFDKVQEG